MKKKIFVVSLFLILALSFGLTSAQAQEATPAKKTVKILTIGNSFAESLRRYFPQIVASTEDCKLVIGYLNIGGCSFERHWGNIEKEIADPTTPAHFKETYLSKIKSEDWDFISIQQVSAKSWVYDSYQPFADKMIEFLKANSNAIFPPSEKPKTMAFATPTESKKSFKSSENCFIEKGFSPRGDWPCPLVSMAMTR